MYRLILILHTIIALNVLAISNSPTPALPSKPQTSTLAPELAVINEKISDKYMFSLYSQFSPNKQIHKDHAEQVANFCDRLASYLKLPTDQTAALHKAAVLHDLRQTHEDMEFSQRAGKFAKENNVKGIYARFGLFNKEEFDKDLNHVVQNMEKAGFAKHFAGQTYRVYNDDGSWETKQISEQNALQVYALNESTIDQFAPVMAVKAVKNANIPLSPLEQSLIHFHHTNLIHITIEKLRLTFPKMRADELAKLHKDIHKLLPVLVCADMLEASSNAFRGRMLYNRQKETIEHLFVHINGAAAIGNITPEVYNACVNMLQQADAEFKAIILKSRSQHEFHLRDFVTIAKLNPLPLLPMPTSQYPAEIHKAA